jgi:hypothetical protein
MAAGCILSRDPEAKMEVRDQFFPSFQILTLGLCVAGCFAQIPQGQILGTTTDSTGAAVVGATVTLENRLTGIRQTATTNEHGMYAFPYLDSGVYSPALALPGFKAASRSGITVQVSEKMRVDFELELGQVNEQIEIIASATVLDTDSSTLGSIVSRRELSDLPLAGREFSRVALTMPGVLERGVTGSGLGPTQFATAVNVGGTNWQKNNYNIDGVDNTFYRWDGPAMNPSLDAIQEFRIDRSLFSAEFGRGGRSFQWSRVREQTPSTAPCGSISGTINSTPVITSPMCRIR